MSSLTGVVPQILVRPRELTHVQTGVTFVLSCVALGEPTPSVQCICTVYLCSVSVQCICII